MSEVAFLYKVRTISGGLGIELVEDVGQSV
jgi:hypothetical protein